MAARHKLVAYGAAGLAVIALAAGALYFFVPASTLSAWLSLKPDPGKFTNALNSVAPADAQQYALAKTTLGRLQDEIRQGIVQSAPLTIDHGAGWRRQLRREAIDMIAYWSPVARCIEAGPCVAQAHDAAACVDLSMQYLQLGWTATELTKLEGLLWSGLGGPGLSMPDLGPLQTVVEKGCESAPDVLPTILEARKSAIREELATARRMWSTIRTQPSLEAVQRYATLYGGARTGERHEVIAVLATLQERQRLVTNKAFCDTLVKSLDSGPDDRKLVLALSKAAVKPAYCVTARGTATCGWPDFLGRLSDAYPSGASLRADALIEAMQSCVPVQGEITRETYENPDNPGCPAEQRTYSSAGIWINAIVSQCHYAQLRVTRHKTG